MQCRLSATNNVFAVVVKELTSASGAGKKHAAAAIRGAPGAVPMFLARSHPPCLSIPLFSTHTANERTRKHFWAHEDSEPLTAVPSCVPVEQTTLYIRQSPAAPNESDVIHGQMLKRRSPRIHQFKCLLNDMCHGRGASYRKLFRFATQQADKGL